MNHKQCNLRYIKISFFSSLRLCVKHAETEGFFVIVSRLALVQYTRIISNGLYDTYQEYITDGTRRFIRLEDLKQ